jgi:hypothetical protein
VNRSSKVVEGIYIVRHFIYHFPLIAKILDEVGGKKILYSFEELQQLKKGAKLSLQNHNV